MTGSVSETNIVRKHVKPACVRDLGENLPWLHSVVVSDASSNCNKDNEISSADPGSLDVVVRIPDGRTNAGGGGVVRREHDSKRIMVPETFCFAAHSRDYSLASNRIFQGDNQQQEQQSMHHIHTQHLG